MNFTQLQTLAEQNDVRITSHENHFRTPPHFYDSLREAFRFYFNTFNTQNWKYDNYAEGLSRNPAIATRHDFLDEENTVLSIVAFERFFELFIKDILSRTHEHLAHSRKKEKGKRPTILDIVIEIQDGKFSPQGVNGNPHSVPFSETLSRFYGLIQLTKNGVIIPLVEKFKSIMSQYSFLDSPDHKASLDLLNWYRNRILHNGDKLPSLWMLDYVITQRLIPIIADIIHAEGKSLGDSLFYTTTPSGTNIIEELNSVRYDFEQLFDTNRKEDMYVLLLFIGHLKELGRASMNMNLYMRNNSQATYEYNYGDPMGRGKRIAKIELAEHPSAVNVIKCMCCDVESMVVYRTEGINFPEIGLQSSKPIEWVKCYTCEYHLRYNAGDPYYFKLRKDKFFT